MSDRMNRPENPANVSLRRCRLSPMWAVACLAFLALALAPISVHAQGSLGPNSFVDTVFVDTVLVPAGGFDEGDTVWVGVGVDHDTAAVAGVHLRLVMPDSTKLRPIRILDQGQYFVPAELTQEAINARFHPDTVTFIVSTKDTTFGAIFNCLLFDFNANGSLPIGKQTIFRIPFICKAGIAKGNSVALNVLDPTAINISDPFSFYNEITYSSALTSIHPVLGKGLVLFDTTGVVTPGNNPPAIAFDPTTTVYNIRQGETVSFSVTATDPDTTNDLVTLSATLPSGATFTPSNPVSGTVTVSGAFQWTPNFSQDGTFAAVFSASDGKSGGSASRSVTIIVEKQQVDVLFSTSSFEGLPRGGIPGKRSVMLPIDVLATRVIYGLQFDLLVDRSAFRIDSIIPTEKLAGFTVWDNAGNDPDTFRVITFSVAGDSIPLGGVSAIMELAVTVDSNAVPGTYPVVFANSWEAITSDPGTASIPMTSRDGVLIVDRLGDVNLDTLVNVADMVGLTSYILGSFPLSERSFDAADVNVDTAANVIDLVAIINAVLGVAPLTAAPRFEGGQAELNLVYGGMEGDNAVFYLDGQMPTDVAGMELTLSWDPDKVWPAEGLSAGDQANGLTMQTDYSVIRRTDRMKIVGYYDSKAEHAVQAGSGRYLKVPVILRQPWTDVENPPIKIESVVLSDMDAAKVGVKGFDDNLTVLPTDFMLEQNYPNPFNPKTTIAFTINGNAGEHVSLNVYNVLGQHVTRLVDEPLSSGRYEVVWDGRNAQGTRVASGLYLYRLVVGDRNETRKMVLLK